MAPAWPEPLTTPVSEGAALLWMASSWTNFIKHIGSPQCAIERSNGSVKWRGFQQEPQLLVCCCAVVRLISLPSSLMHTRGLQFPNPVCRALTSLRRSGIEVRGQLWWARCCLTHKARHNRPFLQEKKKYKNKFAQMSSTTDLSLNFTLPVFQNITVHLLWGLVPHPTMRPQNCQHLLLPLCAYGKQVPTCHLCHQLGLWQGKKKEQVLTSLQRQLRFGTQLLKSDMSMQGICAWKAFQGKFSIPFLSLCMRHSTFNSIPQDGNR